MQVIDFILVLVLLLISYQDFKSREVSLILFPVAFVLVIWFGVKTLTAKEMAIIFLINTAIFLLELFLVWIYFSLKEKQIRSFVNKKIGLGDILFIPVLAAGFSIGQFNIFIIFSLMIILLFWIFYGRIFQTKGKMIPLAGGWALLYAVVILSDIAINKFSRYDDGMLIEIIQKYNG